METIITLLKSLPEGSRFKNKAGSPAVFSCSSLISFSGVLRSAFILLFLSVCIQVSAQTNGQSSAQTGPSSTISGPLKSFAGDSSIVITSEIASDAQPSASYRIADNTSGAFIISQSSLQYSISTGVWKQTVFVNPGSRIGRFNIQLIATSAVGNCESSKSVTVLPRR